MSSTSFEIADEVQEFAERIIDQHHPHLQDAKDKVGYFFKYGSSDWAGKCKKCTAFEREITGKMFLIFVNKDAWSHMDLTQREALVDHELCHIKRASSPRIDSTTNEVIQDWAIADEPESWSTRDHDIEEFSDVVNRHGLWEKGIEKFAVAVRNAPYQMDFEELEKQRKLKVAN